MHGTWSEKCQTSSGDSGPERMTLSCFANSTLPFIVSFPIFPSSTQTAIRREIPLT